MSEMDGEFISSSEKSRPAWLNLRAIIPFVREVGLFGLLVAPLPRVFQTPLGQSMLNATHLPVFACFVWIGRSLFEALFRMPSLRANLTSFGLVAFGAVALELVQPKFGRPGSLEDAVIGLVGAVLAQVTPWFFERGNPRGKQALWLAAVVVASVAVLYPALQELKAIQYRKQQFPLLGDF